MHLYLIDWSKTKEKHRYNNAFTIEDDIPVQTKIILNKVKTSYTNAIEVLQTFSDEVTS